MKVKNVKLEWNVLYWNSNKKKVESYNIFNDSIKDDIYKQIKNKKIIDYNELKNYINRWAMYYYWSKTECEMAIGPSWPNRLENLEQFEKVDIYKQIKINLDRIIEYIINTMEIKFKRSD